MKLEALVRHVVEANYPCLGETLELSPVDYDEAVRDIQDWCAEHGVFYRCATAVTGEYGPLFMGRILVVDEELKHGEA